MPTISLAPAFLSSSGSSGKQTGLTKSTPLSAPYVFVSCVASLGAALLTEPVSDQDWCENTELPPVWPELCDMRRVCRATTAAVSGFRDQSSSNIGVCLRNAKYVISTMNARKNSASEASLKFIQSSCAAPGPRKWDVARRRACPNSIHIQETLPLTQSITAAQCVSSCGECVPMLSLYDTLMNTNAAATTPISSS